MKNIILIMFLMVGFTSYSQVPVDTNQICIPSEVGRKILLDLNLLDKLKKDQILYEKQVKELEDKCDTQDNIINTLEEKDKNNQIIIETHKEKFSLVDEENKNLRKDIKKIKTRSTIVEVFTGVVLTTIIYIQFFK
jgi:hypothetical protein